MSHADRQHDANQQHNADQQHDADTSRAAEAGHQDHGHGGTGKYWAVFLALCLLTSASFFTYSDAWPFHDTPAIGRAFMMAVSCTKALLVVMFFMHLLWEASWKYVLTLPAAVLSLFLVLMLIPDIGCRYPRYSVHRRVHAAEAHDADLHGHTDKQEAGDH